MPTLEVGPEDGSAETRFRVEGDPDRLVLGAISAAVGFNECTIDVVLANGIDDAILALLHMPDGT
jgi:hypothetical protein